MGWRLLRGALVDILVVALAAVATAARAQEPAACDAGRAGLVACVAGRLCACGFSRGGSMTGLPDGYRWDCDINRPPCPDAVVPATIDAFQGPLPDSVDLSRSTTVIRQQQQQQQESDLRQRNDTSIDVPPPKPPMQGGHHQKSPTSWPPAGR